MVFIENQVQNFPLPFGQIRQCLPEKRLRLELSHCFAGVALASARSAGLPVETGKPEAPQPVPSSFIRCGAANDGKKPGLELGSSIVPGPAIKHFKINGLHYILRQARVVPATTQCPGVTCQMVPLQLMPQIRFVQ